MTTKTHSPTVATVNAAKPEPATGAALQSGTVKALLTEQEAMVTLDDGEQVHALQATSCLLAPVIGDMVLVYKGPERSFMLSVLSRDADVIAEIGVSGAQEIAVKTKGSLTLSAPEVKIGARRLMVVTESLMQTGKQLVNHFSRSLETYVDKIVSARTITTTAQSRSSAIKEAETLKAGVLVQNIDSVATQNSDISMITAEQDVRLDAERVSVG